MNLPFKAIISDLDGTLLDGHHQINEQTIQILEKVFDLGVDVFLATGRSYHDVKNIIKKVNIDKATLITSNGARTNLLSGETISQHFIDKDLARQILDLEIDPNKIIMNLYQDEQWFVNIDDPSLLDFHKDSGFQYKAVDISNHYSDKIDKIFYIGSIQDLAILEKQIHNNFAGKISYTYSLPTCLEIMALNVSKGRAIKELISQKNYDLKDCIAFGDGLNDYDMLAIVGKGCLMQNADARLKEKLPHLEVIGNHKDSAVAQYLQKLFNL